MVDRRGFLNWLASLAGAGRSWAAGRTRPGGPPVTIEARPTAVFQQPDGRSNLVHLSVTGLDAPAGRARVSDRHGTLVGTAGLLPNESGTVFSGEVWVPLPLAAAADFQIDVEVGKQRLARRRVRLAPPRRWTLYWLSTNRTDIGYTDLQERVLETHRENLDAALARLPGHPDYRWTAECAYQVISYLENRPAAARDALLAAIRDGKLGFQALFANLLTGLLDHETYARVVWPAGLLAREHGLEFASAQQSGVPGQPLTFPLVLAASGVRYLATGVDPERALPLLPADEAARHHLAGEWTSYPQLYWWEAPDGSRVLHWRALGYADGLRFGFEQGPEVMARRLADWLDGNPVFLSPAYPYDVALVYGAQRDNAAMDDALIGHLEDFNRRFAFPRIVPGRAEDFFHAVAERYGRALPVRRGDTGLYWEDGAASMAAALADFRRVQLSARAAELLALWDERTEGRDAGARRRAAERAASRRTAWRQLLLFGEHTWGAETSVAEPDGPQTVAQWEYKRRFLDAAAAAVAQDLADGLGRLGTGTDMGTGRVVFNASTWSRSDVLRVPDGAGKRLSDGDRPLPAVDLPDGSALVLVRDVPPLGYLRLTEADRGPAPPADEGDALEAQAGGFHVSLDPGSGAIRSLRGPDDKERVSPGAWGGLNQLVRVTGGLRTALWTDWARDDLATPADLRVVQSELIAARRQRLPGIGVRLVIERRLEGFPAVQSVVTLYDELPWVDCENRVTKRPTLEKEALYVAFPFAFTSPVVDVEVPLGRMTVERDQQPGSCRDWYCHTHWVWLHEGADGVLWSGPDTPLCTLGDVFRGTWRRRIEPSGTLFAYAMHNYWHTNFAARQSGEATFRFRVSLLAPGGDAAEPVRRGWAAADPLYVSARFTNVGPGPLIARDRALFVADPGALVIGAKCADDGAGAIVKVLDVAGTARPVSVWPAAYAFTQARRVNLVEMNGDPLPVTAEGHVTLDLPAWGVVAARLFTPAESAG